MIEIKPKPIRGGQYLIPREWGPVLVKQMNGATDYGLAICCFYSFGQFNFWCI